MYYLVCYETETAVAVEDGKIDVRNLRDDYPPKIQQFLKTAGKCPIALIDQNYPSYGAVLDNYRIIS